MVQWLIRVLVRKHEGCEFVSIVRIIGAACLPACLKNISSRFNERPCLKGTRQTQVPFFELYSVYMADTQAQHTPQKKVEDL